MVFYLNILSRATLLLGLIVLNIHLTISQENYNQFQPLDLKFGVAIGNKSHVGNFGITANLYVTKRISTKVSLGAGTMNYGGGVISIGPEIEFLRVKNNIFSIGTTYTWSGKTYDVLGDDDAINKVSYNTSKGSYLRSFIAYTIKIKYSYLSFEGGYSYAVTKPTYIFNGIPSQKQIDNLERGINSGWLATISINGLFNLKKSRTTNSAFDVSQ